MSYKERLAIVIPAYKKTFLERTLESIANQTCKDFKLYIGDDYSPHDLYSIIKKYEDKINIVYKRFDNNLGAINLVHQWNRCVELVKEENWIWLFSDDDEMGPNCIELFYKEIKKNRIFDLYHFNVNIIDESGIVIKESNYPDVLSITNFNKLKLSGKISSYVTEYVFRNSSFDKVNGFEEFDLAWCSDDAIWTKIGFDKGIKTIPNATVSWRQSNENISPNNIDKEIVIRKIDASMSFINWILDFYRLKGIKVYILYFSLFKWYISTLTKYLNVLDSKQIENDIRIFFKKTKTQVLYILGLIYFKIKK